MKGIQDRNHHRKTSEHFDQPVTVDSLHLSVPRTSLDGRCQVSCAYPPQLAPLPVPSAPDRQPGLAIPSWLCRMAAPGIRWCISISPVLPVP